MQKLTWTEEEESAIRTFCFPRCHPRRIAQLAERFGRTCCAVRRHRRELRKGRQHRAGLVRRGR